MGVEGYCTFSKEYGERIFISTKKNDKKISTNLQTSPNNLNDNYSKRINLINSNCFSISPTNNNKTARKWQNISFTINSNEIFLGRPSDISCNNNRNNKEYNDKNMNYNEESVLNLPFGDKYEGEVRNNKPNGKGIYYSITGEIKEGTFIDGHLNGKGKMNLNNGFFIEGNFIDDELDGYGRTININGEIYEGEFKKGIREGKGKLILSNEDRFEGNFSKGKIEGYGKFIGKNGESYKGEFLEGIPNGKGYKKYKDNYEYEGNFKNGKENGFGIKRWKDGQIYEGEFLNGIKNGKGKHTFKDGQKYEGYFVDDHYNGNGEYLWPDGLKYIGEFKDDKIEGKGVLIWPNGDKYEGFFIEGKYNGFGVENKIDGTKYEGEYKNDDYEGHGIKIFSNGEKYEGEFHKGNIHGKGIWYYLDGSSLEGEWNNGNKNGIFKKKSKDGKISLVEYKDNEEIKEKKNIENNKEDKNYNGFIEIEINEEDNIGGKVTTHDSLKKNQIINGNEEIAQTIKNNIKENGININVNNSDEFTEETFNEFTFILLTNFEAKNLNVEIAKDKIILSINNKDKLENKKFLDKLKKNISTYLKCENEESLNDIHKWLYYLLSVNENNQISMQNEFLTILLNIKEYPKEQEIFLTKKIKKYLLPKKDIICKKLKSYNNKYISFINLKKIIEEESIELKEQYFVYLFYALKKFDDPKASLKDLKYEILFDIINDTENDSKMDEESDLEISDDEYNQIISNFQIKLINYINENHTNLRFILNGLIEVTSFEDDNNTMEVVLIKPFFERMKEIGIWMNNDLEIYCIFNRYKLSEKYEGINIYLLEEELNNLKISYNQCNNNSNGKRYMENIKEESEENSVDS